MSSLQDVKTALDRTDSIECIPTRLTPPQLCTYLSNPDWVAILPVRKGSEEINHAVCAVTAQSNHVVLIDYPELKVIVPIEELAHNWDGQVLLVRRVQKWKSLQILGWLFLPIFSLLLGGLEFRQWRLRRTRG